MHLKKQGERDRQRQTCKVCGRKDKFDFYVSEEIWEAVVPPEFRNRVVCLACFDYFAFEKNINYADSLMDLCFAGDQASFLFSIKTAVNVHSFFDLFNPYHRIIIKSNPIKGGNYVYLAIVNKQYGGD